MRESVRSVSGSFSTPVKTRLPKRDDRSSLSVEQLGVAGVHPREQAADLGVEAAQIGRARERRDPAAAGGVFRQAMGLLVGHHLRAVLERSRGRRRLQPVRPRRARRHGRRPPAPGQRLERAAGAQAGIASAQDQLLGLDEELDLADAAAAELDVGALGGEALVDLLRVDLPLDRLDVGDGREIEAAPPDEGRELGQEGARAADVARGRPCLDERHPLPVLAEALVVADRRGDRRGRRRDRRIGPEAQVDAEDIAFGGPGLQHLGQRARDAVREGLGLDAVGQAERLGLVEDREVDVAGVVELERAVLAHGDREEARNGPALRRRPSSSRPASRSRRATSASASMTARSAKRVRAPVTSSRSQTPPRSQSAVSRWRSRLAMRSASSIGAASAAARIASSAAAGSLGEHAGKRGRPANARGRPGRARRRRRARAPRLAVTRAGRHPSASAASARRLERRGCARLVENRAAGAKLARRAPAAALGRPR